MLTSTYTLVALSVEQTTMRAALQSLLDELGALPGDFSTLAAGRAAQLCTTLRQAYDNCHWRKLDKFLVPALRRSTAAADGLLEELERLSGQAGAAMAAAQACVGAADHPVPRDVFCDAVERCVAALRSRLEREEHELFPLARAAVGGDAWFAIAHQMLAHDTYAQERRGDARRLRHTLIGHAGQTVHGHDPLQPEFGRRHATLTVAH
ncbi:hemerythrin domain-containing protein [Massilia rhizosphaerae]|uniref:hemerythrin domain-containing protein n=1 Tax=Massilia rhizosphaerae TaxID=2784389 RepID=UPI0018DE99DC|nr:hemerythrin domain-containing protein [Massilia rhizosphaerae]